MYFAANIATACWHKRIDNYVSFSFGAEGAEFMIGVVLWLLFVIVKNMEVLYEYNECSD
jgi:hypothetical protein